MAWPASAAGDGTAPSRRLGAQLLRAVRTAKDEETAVRHLEELLQSPEDPARVTSESDLARSTWDYAEKPGWVPSDRNISHLRIGDGGAFAEP